MNDAITRIDSLERAEYEAQLWAGEFDADVSKATAFAREWFKDCEDAYRTRFHLRWMLRAFGRYRQQQEALWSNHRDVVWELATQWDIEIVKHLAALNAAGLAGSAALIASNFNGSMTIRSSLLLFAAGLLLAVLNLWLNTKGLTRRLEIVGSRMKAIESAATWADLKMRKSEPSRARDPDTWHSYAICAGWTSAILAIVGAVLIGIALFLTSSAQC